MNLQLVLCSCLCQKGPPIAFCRKNVDGTALSKIKRPMYLCIEENNMIELKKHNNSHPSDIMFWTAVLRCSGKEVLFLDPPMDNQDLLSILKGKKPSFEYHLMTWKLLNFFCLILIQLELIREISAFPKQLWWCNHLNGQTSAPFKEDPMPLFPEVQSSPRIIDHLTVCDVALQCYKYR